MLNIIIKAVFFIIGKVGDIVLLPIFAIINSIFPTVTFSLDYVFNYLTFGLQYVKFFFLTLGIPAICIQLVIAIFTFHFSLFIGVHSYQFVMKVYEKFKP